MNLSPEDTARCEAILVKRKGGKGAVTRDYEVRRAVAQAMGIEVVES